MQFAYHWSELCYIFIPNCKESLRSHPHKTFFLCKCIRYSIRSIFTPRDISWCLLPSSNLSSMCSNLNTQPETQDTSIFIILGIFLPLAPVLGPLSLGCLVLGLLPYFGGAHPSVAFWKGQENFWDLTLSENMFCLVSHLNDSLAEQNPRLTIIFWGW